MKKAFKSSYEQRKRKRKNADCCKEPPSSPFAPIALLLLLPAVLQRLSCGRLRTSTAQCTFVRLVLLTPGPSGPRSVFSDRDSLAMAIGPEIANDKVKTPGDGVCGPCWQNFSFPVGLPIGSCTPSSLDPVGLRTWPCLRAGVNNTVPDVFGWPEVVGLGFVRLLFSGWSSRFFYFGTLGSLVCAWLFCFCFVSRSSTTKRVRAKIRHSKFDKRSPPWFRVVCFECRKLGLGRSGVQRVRVARLRARDRAWKCQCFGRSLKLVRQGASDEVARLRREQPRAKRGLLRQVICASHSKAERGCTAGEALSGCASQDRR